MFKSILVLLDSESSNSGIEQYAAGFAAITQSNIRLVYRMDAVEGNGGNTFTDPVTWSLRKSEATNKLEQLVQHLPFETATVTTTVLDNQPIEMLSQQIDLSDVDLIITAKPSGNLGNSLYTLMKTTTIPILYVPISGISKPHYQNILVPLDGSQRAEYPLPLIQFLCQAFTSRTVLVHVIQPPSEIYLQGIQNGEQNLVTQLIENGQAKANQYLRGFASRLDAPADVQVVVNSNISSSVHQIINAEKIDLVVLSAHGESGEPNLPLGSVAQKLISYASVPVLVVQDLPEKLEGNVQITSHRHIPKRQAL